MLYLKHYVNLIVIHFWEHKTIKLVPLTDFFCRNHKNFRLMQEIVINRFHFQTFFYYINLLSFIYVFNDCK